MDEPKDVIDKVKELQAQKVRMISTYMKMQDEADALNERIYQYCVDIETLNLKIDLAIKEEEKKKKAAARSNGKQHTNGNGNQAKQA